MHYSRDMDYSKEAGIICLASVPHAPDAGQPMYAAYQVEVGKLRPLGTMLSSAKTLGPLRFLANSTSFVACEPWDTSTCCAGLSLCCVITKLTTFQCALSVDKARALPSLIEVVFVQLRQPAVGRKSSTSSTPPASGGPACLPLLPLLSRFHSAITPNTAP